MAINFNQNSAWNLKPIDVSAVRSDVTGLLINGEEIAAAFQTVRDQLVFTNKRIIAIDVQGLTGKRKSYGSMPYSKVQAFSVETAGVFDLDAELEVWFSGLGKVKFEFAGNSNIVEIGRMIGEFALK